MGDIYTATFNELRYYEISPFPEFDFNDITILDKTITKDEFIEKFYDYYGEYQIAYPTPDQFCFEFKRIFNRNYDKFIKQVELANTVKFNLDTYNRTLERNYTTENKYSDTPNETLQNGDFTNKYLTNAEKDEGNGSTNETYSLNDIERFNDIYNKITNILYKFLDLFDECFMNYKSTKTYYHIRRL